ncbi:metallophosphoesterase [Deltaproteobacteria bacterium]|nr:metallophosphoesterase [Deltaproteobacteria bacterium]
MVQKRWFQAIAVICLLLIIGACAVTPPGGPAKKVLHERIVAVGDVHGSYKGLVTILKKSALIDGNNRWIGGNTLLVQTGDLLDRGTDVRKVMDLLMSLQRQAETAGGKVVVLLGNHEIMNMIGSIEYVNPDALKSFSAPDSEERRKKAFEKWYALFGAAIEQDDGNSGTLMEKWMEEHPPGFFEYIDAIGPDGQYGGWIRSFPTMFQYGATLFVHGGISPTYKESSIESINQSIASEILEFDSTRTYLMDTGFVEPYYSVSEMASVVAGILKAAEEELLPPTMVVDIPRLTDIETYLEGLYETSSMMIEEGPLWFRGFAQWPDEQLISYIPEWLEMKDAWRVIVSHTPRSGGRIESRLDGSIFLIDTGMLSEFYEGGQASALEMEKGDVFAFYENDERYQFPPPQADYGIEHVWIDPDGNPLPFNTVEEIELFLKTASAISTEVIRTGVNMPQKVLLEKDGIRFNAIFRHQSETQERKSIPGSHSRTRYFRDSYYSEIAAYEMNRILGLNNMPPTVFRTLDGITGTMQLWAEQTMTDYNRAQEKILPPESATWNSQMWDMRIFDNFINNIDRNQTNILIDDNWRLILIDHTRSFARDLSLPLPKNVVRCSRQLWHALRHLDQTEVRRRLEPYLSSPEIEALFERQKVLVELIRDLIEQNGEENVLF